MPAGTLLTTDASNDAKDNSALPGVKLEGNVKVCDHLVSLSNAEFKV